ncbi:MAG: phosphoglycolate phosphatase [Myxococcota bacterium]
MTRGVVIFDLDGTLVDASPDLTTAINLMLDERGYRRRTLADVQHAIGDGARELVARSLPAGAEDDVDTALERFRVHYRAHIFDETYAYGGVADMLDALFGIPMAVATNKPLGATEAILRALDWERRFVAVIGGDSLPQRKPHPAMLNHILEALDASREMSVMVGDSPQDIDAAHAAGLRCIGVSWGFHPRAHIEQAGADWVVDHPRDLVARIREIVGPRELS